MPTPVKLQILGLVLVICGADGLKCYRCLTEAHGSCNANPDYSSGECPPAATGCFTRMIDTTEMIRECAVDTNRHWRACQEQSVMGCFYCRTDNCNGHTFHFNKTLSCVVCRGDECRTKTELTRCPGKRFYSAPEYCHYAFVGDTLVSKGCGNHPPEGSKFMLCQGDGCNMEVPNSYSSCYEYSGGYEDQGLSKRVRVPCHTEKAPHWRPGCYFKAPWNGRTIESGCLSSRTAVDFQLCFNSAFKFHCQACLGDECNKLSMKMFNFTNRCAAPANSIEFCAYLDSRCYVTQLVISDGRNGTMLQQYAGCLDSGFNPFLLVSPQTHFCDNMRSSVVPCLSLDEDLTKRRSCYQCTDCDNVFRLDHKVKLICPRDTEQCYSVLNNDRVVIRGCDHPSDRYFSLCHKYSLACHRCDYDYCNYNVIVPGSGLCFKTRPLMHPSHLTTLRLEDCTGRYLGNVWGDCYVAYSKTLFIEAGCVSELQAADVARYTSLRTGDVTVINDEATHCYKCTSNQTDFCYNVRHLDPLPCRFQTQYAIRGCYTLINKDTIQRGCLAELDMYHQQMCANDNFMPICNSCRRSYCNIHVP